MRIICILLSLLSSAVFAAGDAKQAKHLDWHFDGAFGTFDKQAIQRGYQVYKEVCASCHSMELMSYRNLVEAGFTPEEVKAIAAEATVMDGPDDAGDMFERKGRPSDRFVSPFENENAARASNGGAYPPDLSLMIKARTNGANYVYSLLTGYVDPPADMKIEAGQYYNSYFPGEKLAMASPLSDDLVEYSDGTKATVDQMSQDIVHFLQWAAEPEMEERKRMGIKVLIFMALFTLLFYLAKKRVWARLDE